MRLSDDKLTHTTHILLKGLLEQGMISPLAEDGEIRREIRRIFTRELMLADEIDAKIRAKLRSYTKKIHEGSPEWEVLYQKFFHEEAAKKGRA